MLARGLILTAAAVGLSGCVSIVSVRSDGGQAHVGVYPFGVRVSRGDAAALSVSARTVGAWSGCAGAGVGVAQVDCDVIDVRACSAALVHARTPDPTLIGRLAGETRAVCPNPKSEP
jgi:hypothetical protein